ncbi:MAG: hypothetical protein A2046_13885 [Bacteroidetes bacterium GWA2_30_7]|nr:MAG: hypothetical protein A2046_13885 [Bacteroidetes bacterium GWA2_30_7]
MKRYFIVLLLSNLLINSYFVVSQTTETKVLIKTDLGDIKIKLYNETPLHRDNFIKLVNEGFYNSLLFHRVINKFMIQTGDPVSKNAQPGVMLGNGGPGYNIPAEIVSGKINKRGALAAAREGDNVNPKRESSGSQFYIVQGDKFSIEQLNSMSEKIVQQKKNDFLVSYVNKPENISIKAKIDSLQKAKNNTELKNVINELNIKLKPDYDKIIKNGGFTPKQKEIYMKEGGAPHLDGAYTVFGEVISGMDIVDKIALVEKDKSDRPIKDIKIISTQIVK